MSKIKRHWQYVVHETEKGIYLEYTTTDKDLNNVILRIRKELIGESFLFYQFKQGGVDSKDLFSMNFRCEQNLEKSIKNLVYGHTVHTAASDEFLELMKSRIV